MYLNLLMKAKSEQADILDQANKMHAEAAKVKGFFELQIKETKKQQSIDLEKISLEDTAIQK